MFQNVAYWPTVYRTGGKIGLFMGKCFSVSKYMSKTIETPPKKWMAHKLLHPCNFNGLFMEKIDVVVLLYLAHFWSYIQPVFLWCKLTLSSFCIWHTFGVACNLWAIYRGSPTYAVFTTAYPTKAVFGLWMHKWGVFTLGGDSLQSY